MAEENKNIVKSTKGGRLYIETQDFLLQEEVKETIETLMDSDLIKEIDKRKKTKLAHA